MGLLDSWLSLLFLVYQALSAIAWPDPQTICKEIVKAVIKVYVLNCRRYPSYRSYPASCFAS